MVFRDIFAIDGLNWCLEILKDRLEWSTMVRNRQRLGEIFSECLISSWLILQLFFFIRFSTDFFCLINLEILLMFFECPSVYWRFLETLLKRLGMISTKSSRDSLGSSKILWDRLGFFRPLWIYLRTFGKDRRFESKSAKIFDNETPKQLLNHNKINSQ